MPMWRCPHCGTPQAETAKCWVCRRSSTTCSTCRHFRRSVAAQLGYCGLDARRAPLTGLELRGCWEAGPARSADTVPMEPSELDAEEPPSPALRLRDFVPVELVRGGSSARQAPSSGRARRRASAGESAVPALPAAPAIGEPRLDSAGVTGDRFTLFADAEL